MPVVSKLEINLLPGNLVMLAGRNGSGKSSLLRVLAGLQQGSSGEVLISGRRLRELDEPAISALVSIMFSTPPAMEMMTAGDLVMTSLQRRLSPFRTNLTPEWAVVDESLKLCGVHDFRDREFSSLSDGEKQKVMLARALAQGTPVVLLDEPLAFLDYPSRREMLNLLHHLAVSENKLIVFSSHDIDISLGACDSLLMLEGNGAWKYLGSQEDLRGLDPMELFKP